MKYYIIYTLKENSLGKRMTSKEEEIENYLSLTMKVEQEGSYAMIWDKNRIRIFLKQEGVKMYDFVVCASGRIISKVKGREYDGQKNCLKRILHLRKEFFWLFWKMIRKNKSLSSY